MSNLAPGVSRARAHRATSDALSQQPTTLFRLANESIIKMRFTTLSWLLLSAPLFAASALAQEGQSEEGVHKYEVSSQRRIPPPSSKRWPSQES